MVDPGIPNTALPQIASISAINSYTAPASSINNVLGWEGTSVAAASQAVNMPIRSAALNQFMNPQIIFPEPALFSGIDANALRPNIETINITIALQSAAWLPGNEFAPQVPLFAGSDISALIPNQNMNAAVTDIQAPEWFLLPIQPALFVGNDVRALYPNNITIVNLVALQNPTWLPAVAFAPQVPLAAANDVSALRPNLNFWPTPIQPEVETPIREDNFLILIEKWWTRYPLSFAYFLTENLGNVTESVVATFTSGFVPFVVNKIQMIIDQW